MIDVAVIGAGPAGAATALELARHGVRVALIDADAAGSTRRRIGENLPPAARPWLHYYGLDATPQLPTRGLRMTWGSRHARWTDHLYSTHGPGLIVDRARFDRGLVDAAVRLGVHHRSGCRCIGAVADADGWRLHLQYDDASAAVLPCRYVVSASGRAAGFAHRQGALRERLDRLVALVHVVPDDTPAVPAYAQIDADVDGWWYASPLPTSERLVVLFTDPDLVPPAQDWRRRMVERGHAVEPDARPQRLAANGYRIAPAHGERWLAVGDAAQAYDPLASAGLMKALVHGRAAALAAAGALAGDARPVRDYAAMLDRAWTDYRDGVREHYRLERRYADAPFWQRRHAVPMMIEPVAALA